MKKRDRSLTAGFLLLVLTLVVMTVDRLILPLPDWAVRFDGITMLLALAVVSYGTARRCGREG